MAKNNKSPIAPKIFFHASLLLYGLTSVAGPLLLGNASVINAALGIQTQFGTAGGSSYYESKYQNMTELKTEALKVIEETAKEGVVLLKNKSNALPLNAGEAVSMYGFGSHYTVLTGQGSSGNSKPSDAVNLYQGVKNAGFTMNEDLYNWYKGQSESTFLMSGFNTSGFAAGSGQETQFVVKDANWSALPSAKEQNAKAAIMVLSRTSGEAEDLYMDVTMDGGNNDRIIVAKKAHNNPDGSVGDALALSDNEKSVLAGLKALKGQGKIDKIIVMLNAASPFQCEFLDDPAYDVDAALWVGTPGTNGCNAVGKILSGEVNPSGKTADTFFKNSKYNPVYFNFGSQRYGNYGALTSGYFSTMGYQNHQYYSVYQEGIYNGYKYTETRYEDIVFQRENVGTFDYNKAVAYPFGYGLSYSTFSYQMTDMVKQANDTYLVKGSVTNTSDIDGKESVQVYVQKPYTQYDITNGIEKAAVELVGFTKVDVPAHQTVNFQVEVEEKYFASYDANNKETYVIGSSSANDDYLVTIAKDSHDAINNIIKYKEGKGATAKADEKVTLPGREEGNANLVRSTHIAFNATKYSTNDFIKNENESFTPHYKGEKANFGVDKITNQFDDVDFQKAGIFSSEDTAQPYMTRSNWAGTYGKRIVLNANAKLKEAQKAKPAPSDSIPYPKYNQVSFAEVGDSMEEIKLIHLRGKDFNDPLWEELLDKMSFEETCKILQDGLRYTNGVESIAAPSTSQQNGALAPNHPRTYGELPSQSGFRGFSETLDPDHKSQKPSVYACNGLVAATYNLDLIEKIGEITGEEGIWAGYNGIYGLGVNIHRGAYCGRSFEYYSEDGFLTGMAAGYEAVGMHKYGVFVLMKHAVLNDQETHRAGVNAWANEQTIREIYGRAIEVAIAVDTKLSPRTMLGVMTGMNRMGATWTGGHGFCNTVLKAEYGMRGYVVSDYNSSRLYMGPIQGVLNGNDLPDGNPAGKNANGADYDGNDLRFKSYATGHGELAWAMRKSAKYILYTVVNSNAMNGVTSSSTSKTITPMWEKAVPAVIRTTMVVFIWGAVIFGGSIVIEEVTKFLRNRKVRKEGGKE